MKQFKWNIVAGIVIAVTMAVVAVYMKIANPIHINWDTAVIYMLSAQEAPLDGGYLQDIEEVRKDAHRTAVITAVEALLSIDPVPAHEARDIAYYPLGSAGCPANRIVVLDGTDVYQFELYRVDSSRGFSHLVEVFKNHAASHSKWIRRYWQEDYEEDAAAWQSIDALYPVYEALFVTSDSP